MNIPTKMDEEFLNKNGISNISLIGENSTVPILSIMFENGTIEVVKDIEKIKLLLS